MRAAAASIPLDFDPAAPIAGDLVPHVPQRDEGDLRVTAVVIEHGTRVALVAVDALLLPHEIVDAAAEAIAHTTGIAASNVLINASHTHHGPSPADTPHYGADPVFVDALRKSIPRAVAAANASLVECEARFAMWQEATVGANSRLLQGDGEIYWTGGATDRAMSPTGPMDPDLPVLIFEAEAHPIAVVFSHATHNISQPFDVRSPGFFGMAARELSTTLGCPVAYLSGAAGSTHNLHVPSREATARIVAAVSEALESAHRMQREDVASVRQPFTFRVRTFDEEAEEAAVAGYCNRHLPSGAHIDFFRQSRAALARDQGEQRMSTVHALRIGDLVIAATPAELYASLGLSLRRSSPHRWTWPLGLCNDHIGYTPDQHAFELGGYSTWMGLHSYAERGTGERLVSAALEALRSLE